MPQSGSDGEAGAAKKSNVDAAEGGGSEGDAPPSKSVVAAAEEQPIDPSGDTKRLVERLNAPEGKKLFIGGISWRSDEGKFREREIDFLTSSESSLTRFFFPHAQKLIFETKKTLKNLPPLLQLRFAITLRGSASSSTW